MKFIEVTNEAGAQLHVPDKKIAYALKEPMQPTYILGMEGAVMKIANSVIPYDTLLTNLKDSDEPFEVFPIPEGTDAIVNPNQVLFCTSVELNITAIMFAGGLKVVVKEGINTVLKSLSASPDGGQLNILRGD